MKWSQLPSRLVSSMLAGHLALGLAASALVYILCVSGTVLVFHEEIERWEQPHIPQFSRVSPEAVQRAAENVIAQLETTPDHFYVGLPTATLPRLWVATDTRTWFFDQDGHQFAEADHEWSHFLEKLHYYLTLPWVIGLTVVGILGVLMTALCLSGIFALPRLFRDAFHLRLTASERLRKADWHNRLGVWGLPFHLVIAATGAALGLSILVANALAPTVNDGDVQSFFAPVFGPEVDGDETPAPLADVGRALENFQREHPESEAWYFNFHHPATVGQDGMIVGSHPRRLIFAEYYAIDSQGDLTGKLGLSDGQPGQQVFASLYPLHFGSFGGLPVKLAYGLLGLAACMVAASGFAIWLLKRRQRRRPLPLLERGWAGVIWGTPLALIGVMLVDLVVGPGLEGLIALFWIALVVFIIGTVILEKRVNRRALQWACAAGLAATVVAHLFIHGNAALQGMALGLNVALLALAGWAVWLATRPLVAKPTMHSKQPG